MSRTIVIGLVLALACGCLLSGGAAAQSQNCYALGWWQCHWWDGGGCGVPPAPLFNCQSIQYYAVICNYAANCNVPPHWCPTCGQGTGSASSPINLTNGNTYIQETDLRLSGLGGGLALERTWNSIIPSTENQTGMFGLHWISTYEERVFLYSWGTSQYLAYQRSDGGLWYFPSGGGALASPANEQATLTQNGTQTWTITFKDGSKKVFSYTSGSLTQLVDRNGNTTNLTYDLANRLTTVADPASRHLYFTYQNGSSLLVTSVTSDFGVSTSYSYDPQGRLTQVTEPDQSTISFQYNSQSLISSVLDTNGVVLESHTYDSQGRGLTASRANGVDAVTISYPQ